MILGLTETRKIFPSRLVNVHPPKVAHATKNDKKSDQTAERFDPYSWRMRENWYVQCVPLLRMTNAVLRKTRTEIIENYEQQILLLLCRRLTKGR